MLAQTAAPSTMQTERLRLCPPTVAMAAEIFAAIDGERPRLQTYLPWVQHVKTVEDEEAFILLSARQWFQKTCFGYAMFNAADNCYVGHCGFVDMQWAHHYAEVGYWIRGDYEGMGLVTEACAALEQAACGMGLHRLEIHCSTQNARSAGVPERLGYKLEGVCREDFYAEGAYHDTAIYGKILAST